MDELVEWLRVQLDDDERVARGAGGAQWVWRDGVANAEIIAPMSTEGRAVRIDAGTSDVRKHLARHDPARVLRDVGAKRQILEVTLRWMDAGYPTLDVQLRLLALPYSDRPGYREEWRP